MGAGENEIYSNQKGIEQHPYPKACLPQAINEKGSEEQKQGRIDQDINHTPDRILSIDIGK